MLELILIILGCVGLGLAAFRVPVGPRIHPGWLGLLLIVGIIPLIHALPAS